MSSATRDPVERLDFFRWPVPHGGSGLAKEWMHFCIYGEGVDLLVNFSLVETGGPEVAAPGVWGRVIVLVRDETWWGHIARFAGKQIAVETGHVRGRWGACALSYDAGAYDLRVPLAHAGIDLDLRLVPAQAPVPAHEIPTGDGPAINWVVLPRLEAYGRARLRAREARFEGALAYHDHNWGEFAWGADFAWEWGYGLPRDPENPWSFVFVRLSDRAHAKTLMQGAFLWEGARAARTFRGEEIELRRHGLLRPDRVSKIPPVMDLAHPGTASDVPARLTLEAWSPGASFEASFESQDLAQVLVPNDRDSGLTVINEVAARFRLRGQVNERPVAIEGGAIFEYLGG